MHQYPMQSETFYGNPLYPIEESCAFVAMKFLIFWVSLLIFITRLILPAYVFFLWDLLGTIYKIYMGIKLYHCEGIPGTCRQRLTGNKLK